VTSGSGSGVTAWETERKQAARSVRYDKREEDPRRPGVLVSRLEGCPHGTEYGYVEYGCRCRDLGPEIPDPDNPGKWIPTGCRQAGSRAAAERRKRRLAAAEAPTEEIPTQAPREGHDSALAMLDNLRNPMMFRPKTERLDPQVRPSRHLLDP
jgi:hypothetical protein